MTLSGWTVPYDVSAIDAFTDVVGRQTPGFEMDSEEPTPRLTKKRCGPGLAAEAERVHEFVLSFSAEIAVVSLIPRWAQRARALPKDVGGDLDRSGCAVATLRASCESTGSSW